MFERTLKSIILDKMFTKKAIIIVGARQVGKTTLIKEILQGREYLFFDGDDLPTRSLFTRIGTEEIRTIVGSHTIVFIDEAQRIPDIGITLKIIIDQMPHVQVIATGSSAFDLNNKLQEPLTGRKWEYQLYPISWEEYEHKVGYLGGEQQLHNRLIYGMYPDVIVQQGNEPEVLKNLVSSYLYKDVLAFTDIKQSEVLDKLLTALALQVGNEVNYNELAGLVEINKVTVQKYVEILEQSYIIFRLTSFSRNVRNEIKKNRKIYFYDNGVRNAIMSNFSHLDIRADKGALWENFLMSERKKYHEYHSFFTKMHFWRTKQQQEVDCVEEKDGKVRGFEFKWKEQKVRLPKSFLDAYNAEAKIIHRNNFREFVMPKSL